MVISLAAYHDAVDALQQRIDLAEFLYAAVKHDIE
jgi:hypothetical protein